MTKKTKQYTPLEYGGHFTMDESEGNLIINNERIRIIQKRIDLNFYR